jgi:flavin reductase (DIM6/NTAB) family NADH-FMN oxidoreductase RutF
MISALWRIEHVRFISPDVDLPLIFRNRTTNPVPERKWPFAPVGAVRSGRAPGFPSSDSRTGMEINNKTAPVDPQLFRRVMGRFATGVTVITAAAGGKTHGMTANAFMSGSLEPPLCVVSVAKRARMHAFMTTSEHFAVNILAEGQEQVADYFARKSKSETGTDFATIDGVPVLAEASARILAEMVASHDCGDHTLFIGHIRSMSTDDRPPLVFHAARFGAFEPHGPEGSVPDIWDTGTEYWLG